MKKKALINVLLVGRGNGHLKEISNLSTDAGIKLSQSETLSQASKQRCNENSALYIVDINDDKGLLDALQFTEKTSLKNTSFLFLVDGKCEKTELFSRAQDGSLDCLIKPLVQELLVGRVKHLLNAFKLKMSLETEMAEREKLLTSLLDEKRYADSLIDSSMDMIISVDLNRNIFEFNSPAQETFGYTKKEVIGKPVDLLYAEKSQSLKVYQKTLKDHQYSAEIINRRKNGELFPSLISASILVERGGETLGLMGISRDISDFKRVEADLKRTKEDAEAANRAKSEFLTHMSHEIRTPMTSIIGYAELLEDGFIGNQELLEFVRSIKRNGQHLLQLINDILDLSQVEKGKLTLNPVYCSPSNIISNLYHIMRGKSEDKGIAISVNYQGKIPKFIYSDPTRILQCLVNLVGNAIKFTPKGGKISICVEYFLQEEEPFMRLKIIDTGIGIPANKLHLVMQPFEQGDISNTMSLQGVGLGLPITRRLALILGGSLSVESKQGAGSTFTLEIQCGISPKDVRLVEIDGRNLTIPADESNNRQNYLNQSEILDGRILLAEDNADIRKLVTKILTEAGAIVDAVDAGPQVLEKVHHAEYDLVLMDMQLPLMDGETVVRKLRESGHEKPIVALTASAMRERLKGFLESGCNECAVKPIGRYELVQLAHKWLKRKDKSIKTSKHSKKIGQSGNGKASARQGSNKNPSFPDIPTYSSNNLHNLIYSTYHNDPEMQKIVKDYVNSLPIKLENITNAIQQDDLQELRKIVHGLHGSGGGYGFEILSKYGEEIEKKIDHGLDKNTVASLIKELQEVIGRIMNAYKV